MIWNVDVGDVNVEIILGLECRVRILLPSLGCIRGLLGIILIRDGFILRVRQKLRYVAGQLSEAKEFE